MDLGSVDLLRRGYPGAGPFVKDHSRWVDYIVHSLIESGPLRRSSNDAD